MTILVAAHWNKRHILPSAETGQKCFYVQFLGFMLFIKSLNSV